VEQQSGGKYLVVQHRKPGMDGINLDESDVPQQQNDYYGGEKNSLG
jgi:hypothetical protein